MFMGKCTFPSKSSPAEKNLAGPDGPPVPSRNHHFTSLQTLYYNIWKQRPLPYGEKVPPECAEIRVFFSSSSRVMARQRDMTRASHVGACGPVPRMMDEAAANTNVTPGGAICLRASERTHNAPPRNNNNREGR